MRTEAPPMYRGIVERARASRAAAVKANCLQCCGWKRDEVAACAITDCPMWVWRPYQSKIAEENEEIGEADE